MPRRLERVQRWLQALIVDPRPARVAVRRRSVRSRLSVREVGEVVLPSSTLTALERIDIYGGMYFSRLGETLAADYPVLRQHLDEHSFFALSCAYVQAHPSRHPNLSFLGANLPGFVARRAGLQRRRFLAELARLEWAVAESFNAPESRRLEARELEAVAPERWGDAVLSLAPHVRILAFRHPVNRFYQAVKEEKTPRVPRAAESWLAVYRKDDRVWRMDLTRGMHRVLSAIAEGAPLGRAVARAPRAARALTIWFKEWMREGFFEKILVVPREAGSPRNGSPLKGGRSDGGPWRTRAQDSRGGGQPR